LRPKQRTIASEVAVSGIGVNTGRKVNLRLRPAPAGSGVAFVRADLEGKPVITARPENIARLPRRSGLKAGDATVQMTEHLLSACAGLGIDNLVAELDSEELPALDGSPLAFAQLIQGAGILEQDAPRPLHTVREPLTVADGPASISVSPATDALTVSYELEFDKAGFSPQRFSFRLDEAAFMAEVAPARTFVFQSDAAKLLAQGFGRGADPENTLLLRDDGSLVYGEFRFPDELARHKVADLLGDLSLLGRGFRAQVVARRTGHAQNLAAVEQIASGLLQPIEED